MICDSYLDFNFQRNQSNRGIPKFLKNSVDLKLCYMYHQQYMKHFPVLHKMTVIFLFIGDQNIWNVWELFIFCDNLNDNINRF